LEELIGGEKKRGYHHPQQATNKRPTSDQQATMLECVVSNTERDKELKEKTQKYFDEFDSNTISIFCARHNKEEIRVRELKEKEEKLMTEIMNSEVSDIFCKLLIAEYKEMLYESIYYPYFEYAEMLHMEEYERIIMEYYGENTLWEHEHDPSHFMYDDDKHSYMFFEMIESKGFYILDENDRKLAFDEDF
jgi:hypothetical protein